MKPLKITPVAFNEIQTAIEYYNRQTKGLGEKFRNEIVRSFAKIRKMPKASSFLYDTVRYKVVAKYPFIITYEELDDSIAILHIFNVFRNPENMQ